MISKGGSEILKEIAYLPQFFDLARALKSEREAIEELKHIDINIEPPHKYSKPFEDFNRVEKDIEREHMADLQRKLNELKGKLERGKEINPEDFKLEIITFEELEASAKVYKLLKEKIESMPTEKRAPYEQARRYLLESGLEYTRKELEANLQNYLRLRRRKRG